jgi:hypothetical protein
MVRRLSAGATVARFLVTFCLLWLVIASAAPTTYELVGVVFNDGGTATGYFTFDPDAGTPCSLGVSPCGRYSNVNIVTTAGSARAGATYTFVCGQDVPTCTGVIPDSTQALNLTSSATNQTGLPGLALFFTGVGAVPPAGLGNAQSYDISNSSLSVGAGQEASCGNATCSFPAAPARDTVAGTVVALGMDTPFQVSYAANPAAGESYINIINTGANGASLLGPGFGAAAGNICVNVYAFAPDEQEISCCSCLLTPNSVANLGVNRDLTGTTLTGVVPTSVVVKLVATLAGTGGSGTSCSSSAATEGTPVFGLAAYGTTPQPVGSSGFSAVEHTFVASTLSAAEYASITGRCASILGNGSGFGVCSSCRSGALGASKQ